MKWEKQTGFGQMHSSNDGGEGMVHPMPSWMLKALIVFFFVVGLALCALCAFFVNRQLDFMKTAVTAKAKIVDMVEDTGDIGKDDTVYRPILELRTSDGTVHTIKSTVGYSRGQQKVGETVEVLYAPGKPETAEQNSFIANWWSAIIGFIGLAFFAASGMSYWIAQRQPE